MTPTVTFQRVTNSDTATAKKNDLNLLTFGGGGEVAVGNLLDDTMTHYFRLRGAAVTTFDSEMKSWNVVGEYQPLSVWKDVPKLSEPNRIHGLPLLYEIDPILRSSFSHKVGAATDPLFNQGADIFRAGPVLSFGLMPVQSDLLVPKWLQKASFTASYSWLNDFRHRQTHNHFNTALNYAFDNDGNVGMKLSYEKGKVEETGQDIAMTKVGLTAKY